MVDLPQPFVSPGMAHFTFETDLCRRADRLGPPTAVVLTEKSTPNTA